MLVPQIFTCPALLNNEYHYYGFCYLYIDFYNIFNNSKITTDNIGKTANIDVEF